MRVIEIAEPGGPEVLVVAERDMPMVGADELLIEVAAAGVNRPDVIQRMGLYPPPKGASDLPGLEVAGTVADVGKDVRGWRTGDKVCALVNGGGYAEFASVAAGQCLPVPAGWSFEEAAGLPETFFTVWSNVFDRAGLCAGETFLVHGGSSGIGVSAIQMAVAMGATAFATAGSAAKCAACEKLGAAFAVNYKTEDFVDELKEFTAGNGVDVILDMVGGDYVGRNIRLAAIDGRIVNINYQKGFEATVNFAPMLSKRLALMASTLRPQSAASKTAIAEALRANIWPKIEAGKIVPVVANVFTLAQAADAHRLMESSAHIGKIILSLDG
ncbi:MAG: NAD(P)H-quinone oxidoreductase [Gammaproteobacteria bacterium]|nr:NAD(P)H-quinone oxidoreductase [Gammaproteobacteria bacterium]